MQPDDFLASGILEAYALGSATAEEAALCEEMISRYPQVAAEYEHVAQAIEESVSQYARTAPTGAWAAISQQLVAEMAPEAPTMRSERGGRDMPPGLEPYGRRGRQVFLWQWVSTGLAALLVMSLGINFYFYQANDALFTKLRASEEKRQQITFQAGQFKGLYEHNWGQRKALQGLLNQALMPNAEGIIRMQAMPAAPKGKVAVSFDRDAHIIALRGTDMPPMPEGKVVQLWAIVKGKPVSLGLANEIVKGEVVMAGMPSDMGEPEAFALSLEVGNAHTEPEGPILAMGKVY